MAKVVPGFMSCGRAGCCIHPYLWHAIATGNANRFADANCKCGYLIVAKWCLGPGTYDWSNGVAICDAVRSLIIAMVIVIKHHASSCYSYWQLTRQWTVQLHIAVISWLSLLWPDFTGLPFASIFSNIIDLPSAGWLIMALSMTLDFQNQIHVLHVLYVIRMTIVSRWLAICLARLSTSQGSIRRTVIRSFHRQCPYFFLIRSKWG